jgi:hypothetical protein
VSVLTRAVRIAAALAAAAGAAQFLLRASVKVFYPYLINLGEPALAQSVRYMGLGIWPYHDLSQPPFSVVPYGPVYLFFAAAARHLSDLPLAGGRIVCLASSVIAAACIGFIVTRTSASRLAGLASGCLFLCLPFVERWGVQVNVDMTGVAIELLALTGFFLYAASGHTKRVFFGLGSAAAVTAVFTKSSAIAAAVAWGAYLLLNRRWKDLALYAAAAGGAVVLIYALLNLATGGQYYFHTTHEIGRRLFFTQFIPAFWKETVLRQPLQAVAAAAALAFPAFWRPRSVHAASSASAGPLLNLYLLLTVLMTVSLGKQGSDTNYLLPFLAASTIAAGRWWGSAAAASTSAASGFAFVGWRTKAISFAAAAGIAAQALLGGGVLTYRHSDFRANLDRQAVFYAKISKTVAQFPDPVISWDMTLLIANGRPVYFEPFPMAQAAYSGVWDQKPILDDLRTGRVKLIITYFWSQAVKADRNFTPEFVQALRDHYQVAGRVKIPWASNSILFFYVPKKSPVV